MKIIKNLLLWQIVDWEPDFSVQSGQCGFAIRVSPEFIKGAKSRIANLLKEKGQTIGELNENYNSYWSWRLKEIGMGHMIFSERSIVEFNPEIGLDRIQISGNATELYWLPDQVDVMTRGTRYETHNVDSSIQFLTLLLIFDRWARNVLDEVSKLNLP
ncbi:hypothetical protein KKD19_05415 [Patescibacteria group bacterium]|nr:hypothetical protein [Patescibacteria group bacterium]MBU4512643.1 hypothetical protein [Patescibacteria group bacterium]MCG2693549.1 hypothetical protein [Candidatus Parcubacteria bacterium]